MSLPVLWSDEAIAEFYEAEQWYADVSVQLSERFVKAVEDTLHLIAAFPLRFPIVHRERRRAGVRRFPYGLFYQVETDRILVIACFHGKRNPRRWQRR
ncbi:type II toxin-antitoxin system RelE/ParE family toxin [Silvibacterium bohemicum]|uniref:type II toxin-antitoxin system RelE/ParE family toxin n=1 Tax=Silvibacterium bohemicum TaxID=1577686 RepID=UPI000679D3BE